MQRIPQIIYALGRPAKLILQVTSDLFLLALSIWVAVFLRVDGSVSDWLNSKQTLVVLALLFFVAVAMNYRLGVYRSVVRYQGSEVLFKIFLSLIAIAGLFLVSILYFEVRMPRSVPVIFLALSFIFLSSSRALVRYLNEHLEKIGSESIIIYGAGDAGRQLQVSLKSSRTYRIVAFVDDSAEAQGSVIEGVRVYPPAMLASLIEKHAVSNMLLAIPSASRQEKRAILERLEVFPVHVRTIPNMSDILSGRAEIGDLREVGIEELLGRDAVVPDRNLLQSTVKGKVVLVTGAGGSIGSEISRQVLALEPLELLLLESSEFALYTIFEELKAATSNSDPKPKVTAVLGSVMDARAINEILVNYSVNTIFHAAAYKHVPLVEQNVIAGVKNNVFGTKILVEAAEACGVSSFILISTDKAVRPTNVMGASKRLAELVCQASAAKSTKTVYSMVRFGNVLGSSGSVIPAFRKQIENGGPVTVTHPDITRYFMTIPEAAQLVIQSAGLAKGGDVFLLEMGQSVKIIDLAKKLIRLSGYIPIVPGDKVRSSSASKARNEIEITFTGLRPGEKLFEELLIGNNSSATLHPRIRSSVELSLSWNEITSLLSNLDAACASGNQHRVLKLLTEAPLAYSPSQDIDG